MGLKEMIMKVLGYRLGSARVGYGWEIPGGWSTEQYLQAYGQVGWLFGVVSVISTAVAEVEWHLYRQRNGERMEIDRHPLLDLIAHINPYQTRYEFIQLLQMYINLVGKAYIVINLDNRNMPGEMYLAMPQYMKTLQNPAMGQFISGYLYQQGAEAVSLSVNEVIRIVSPNPMNPLDGLGPAQAIGVDLDSEKNAANYTNRLFYNDARPGLVIEQPGEYIPDKDTRDTMRAEWNEAYRGWRNSHKAAFLWGGAKLNTITMTNRDMDFWRLRTLNEEIILGAYHVPKSVMGISDIGSRARAEADEYIFAKRVIKPALTRIRESLNEQLIPRYWPGGELVLDFDNPVPADRELAIKEVQVGVATGYMTINEARQRLGLDEIPIGDVLIFPITSFPTPVKSMAIEMVKGIEGRKSLFATEEQKEAFWNGYSMKAASFERPLIVGLRALFKSQKREALANFEGNPNATVTLINQKKAQEDYIEMATPIIAELLSDVFENAERLLNPQTPHRGKQLDSPAFLAALAWMRSRIGWAAEELGEETARELAVILASGFEAGEGVDVIAGQLRDKFEFFDKVRAERIARTETIMASNEGALYGYEQSGVVDKVEFYVALDERLCDECLDMALPPEQAIFTLAESHGLIPVHPNCRCIWQPVIEL